MSRVYFAGLWILAAALLMAEASAQPLPPELQWSRTAGGPYGDGAWSAAITRDGGCIVAGYSSSRGMGSDLWLIKLDSAGDDQWNRMFGGTGEDLGYFVLETEDGGYIVTGTTSSYGIGEERLWLLKTDSNGSRIWESTFGGFVSSSGDGGWSVDQTDDGGFIVAGYTRSFGSSSKDLWLVKTDPLGNGQWQKTYGGAKDDVGMSVSATSDGGYIVAGRTASYGAGGDDIWLLKTDSYGKLEWNRTYGGKKDEVAFQVAELKDGYVLVGRTESGRLPGKRAFLMKVDRSGKILWDRVYADNSAGIGLCRASDRGFIIAGRIESETAGRDALLIKADTVGEEVWSMSLGGSGEETATAVMESGNGSYILAGMASSCPFCAEDIWLAKLQPAALTENSSENLSVTWPEDRSLSIVPIHEVTG